MTIQEMLLKPSFLKKPPFDLGDARDVGTVLAAVFALAAVGEVITDIPGQLNYVGTPQAGFKGMFSLLVMIAVIALRAGIAWGGWQMRAGNESGKQLVIFALALDLGVHVVNAAFYAFIGSIVGTTILIALIYYVVVLSRFPREALRPSKAGRARAPLALGRPTRWDRDWCMEAGGDQTTAQRCVKRSAAFLNLDELIRHQPMGFAVHRVGCFLVRSLNQTERLTGPLIEPVLVIRHPVLFLHLHVLLVCTFDRFRRQPIDLVMNIHVERHPEPPFLVNLESPIVSQAARRRPHVSQRLYGYLSISGAVPGRMG